MALYEGSAGDSGMTISEAEGKLDEPAAQKSNKNLLIPLGGILVAVVVVVMATSGGNCSSYDDGVSAGLAQCSPAPPPAPRVSRPPPPPCPGADGAAEILPTVTDPDGTVHFITTPRQISPNEHAQVALPTDYQVAFDIIPGPTINPGWSNIIHFSATGNNCCNYGDRVPGVWFYPGSRRVHIIDGHGAEGAGNDECAIEEELVEGQQYSIQIDMRQKVVEVFYNGVLKCTEPRVDRRVFGAAQVFASDPWHPPCDAVIGNLLMRPLAEQTGCTSASACNYDLRATQDDGSCVTPPDGEDCNGNSAPVSSDGQLPIVIIGDEFVPLVRNAPLIHEGGAYAGAAIRGSYHAVLSLPSDYSVSFTIQPQPAVVQNWANIVHFTATQSNCCDYGDRIPGVWFHPGTHRLHIRDGMDSSGNAGCDPMSELIPFRPHDVRIDIGQSGVVVTVDGRQVCGRQADARRPWPSVHVFASDPWHDAALATIKNLRIDPLANHGAGCMLDTACNRDFAASIPDSEACQFQRNGFDCTNHEMVWTDRPPGCVVDADGGGCGWTVRFGAQNRPAAIQSYSQDPNAPGGSHAILNIPLDYRISFDITPQTDTQESWANIFREESANLLCI